MTVEGPTAATTSTATMIVGSARMASMNRLRLSSSQPRM